MTGAEMVRPETIDAFCEKFGPQGFRREVFRPCYGLAEATLAVSIDLRGKGPRTLTVPSGAAEGFDLNEIVCVGEPVIDTRIRIADPKDRPLPDGDIGEVLVQGPGVFSGYFDDPGATAESLHDGWLAPAISVFCTKASSTSPVD